MNQYSEIEAYLQSSNRASNHSFTDQRRDLSSPFVYRNVLHFTVDSLPSIHAAILWFVVLPDPLPVTRQISCMGLIWPTKAIVETRTFISNPFSFVPPIRLSLVIAGSWQRRFNIWRKTRRTMSSFKTNYMTLPLERWGN